MCCDTMRRPSGSNYTRLKSTTTQQLGGGGLIIGVGTTHHISIDETLQYTNNFAWSFVSLIDHQDLHSNMRLRLGRY
jgi:hypothetical protein